MSKHGTSRRIFSAQHAATNPYRFGAARVSLAIFMSFILFFGTSAALVYKTLADQVKGSTLDISALGAQSGEKKEPLPADQFEGRALNILVAGIDSRYGQTDGDFGSTEEVTTIHADSTMLVHVSADRKNLTPVSIPRDLLTDIPSCTRSDGTVTDAYYGMFNSAFTTGAGTTDLAGGIACTKSTVEQLTGISVDAFMIVDFNGFRGMVRALGGVWMNIDEQIADDESGLYLEPGCQKLDDFNALAYARARKTLGDGSDTSRIGRQQQLISSMLRELLSKNFVTDLPSVIAFLQATIASLSVSSNLSDINTAAGLMLSLGDIERANIRFITMPSYPNPDDPNRVLADEYVAQELWQSLANDTPLPVGIQYTDGNGAVMTVPDPAEAPQSTATAPEGETSEPVTPTETAPTEPAAPEETPAPAPQTCPPSS